MSVTPRVGRSGRAPSLGSQDGRARMDAHRQRTGEDLGPDIELNSSGQMSVRVSGAIRKARDGSLELNRAVNVAAIPTSTIEPTNAVLAAKINELITALRSAGHMEA
jgi:hypothetical protein